MNPSQRKADRLLQLEALLLAHSKGLTQAEIARRLHVDRSTINRYLPSLPGYVYMDDDGRLIIDRAGYLVNVRLNLHEALAVHLATRLLATRTDRQNPHAAAALRKLGIALERLAPRISQHLVESANLMDDTSKRQDPEHLLVLEQLALAWAEERKAQVWHRHAETGRVDVYTFAPYFIEPYAVGQTTHVIGWREPPGAVRTFKVERIQRVELLDERYSIPADFNARELLADAWGIWYTDEAPVAVELRFTAQAARRVAETQWHTSEETEWQPDGSLIWRASVAEPREMVPWIRGWGADCEVLAPAGLRALLVKESRRLAALYGIAETPAHLLIWAKSDRKSLATHLLLYHMIDVGNVALTLWRSALTEATRQRLAGQFGLNVEQTGRLIAFLAALHDLGKASPGFQRRHPDPQYRSGMEKAGLAFPKQLADPAQHGTVSVGLLGRLLKTQLGIDARFAERLAVALGGHHGAWPTNLRMRPEDIGNDAWEQARSALVSDLKTLFDPPIAFSNGPGERQTQNALCALLSGFTSVADWLGSMEDFFPFEDEPLAPSAYAERSLAQAQAALCRLGWLGWQPKGEMISFQTMFPFISQPNDIQQAVIAQEDDLRPPCLVILEAPTGCGKTEIALYLADRWAQRDGQQGMYVAMPTTATSNQMYGRVYKFLGRRYPGDLINLLLAHSQAAFDEQVQAIRLSTIDDDEKEDTEHGRIAAMSWFLPRKRTLLAPFAVGTVDQALMSVLQTKHFFVRLYGLNHKTVIFDEAHAYDTYMSTLFQRLLAWLAAIGTSVIVLSATLPAQTRRELVAAYTGNTQAALPETPYLRLTWTSAQGIKTFALPVPPPRQVNVEWVGREPEAIVQALSEKLKGGGCAAVICNTVGRAQVVYEALRDAQIVLADDLLLFHARFPLGWRQQIEKAVLDRFGKNGQRPERAIVVATQVIEQSLDLDFDLMVSDLAPVDLVLQRVGRLHRHEDTVRPDSLSAPTLLLAKPAFRDELPAFESDAHVYEAYVLLRSYLALRDRAQLTLPADTTEMIESVYGRAELDETQPEPWRGALIASYRKMQDEQRGAERKAQGNLIRGPEHERLFSEPLLGLEEDNPDVHRAFQALTRLIEPGVSLVCLHQTPQGLALDPDGTGAPISRDEPPDTDLTMKLLQQTVTVQHRGVVNQLLGEKPPRGWRRNASLRHHRLAVFTDGVCALGGGYELKLSRELGLQIERKEVQ